MFLKKVCNQLFLLFLSSIFILSCADNSASLDKMSLNKNVPNLEYSVSFTDQMGNKNFSLRPTKVASFSPEITEIIFELGHGNKLVAVDSNSNFPPATSSLPKLGFMNINTESIVQYEPDLIILTAGFEDIAKKLESLDYQVAFIDAPKNLNGLWDNINILGKIFESEDTASQLADSLQQKFDNVAKAVSEIKEEDKQSVFLEIDPTLYTVSSNSLIGHLLDLANVINIAGDVEGSYPQISLEFIVDKNPSIILLNDTQYGNSIQDTLNRDGWSNIEAIKSKKVFALNADWVSRAGPRTIKGLEQIISFVYGVKLLE
tara:strand:- start:40 stop:990 length:951 start_codon:yes stop_codon:yes gene_type:complete